MWTERTHAKTDRSHGFESDVVDWQMFPGLDHDCFVFMTGFAGADADGVLSENPIDQIETIFEKVGMVVKEVGLGFGYLVEMTSYHIGLRNHLEQFKGVRSRYVTEPFPAWTAIKVAGFVRERLA